ncbi:hypothetical protein NE237_028173 [Protea cynaroides]|uniref:Uncharacterized protein n=1 Tax=Protea cynaroides TaxID=273540 RepID=A0A9Q0GQN8_9MAGN|nr:hypothetical protein NE237_028173 [Protea cynaroides]
MIYSVAGGIKKPNFGVELESGLKLFPICKPQNDLEIVLICDLLLFQCALYNVCYSCFLAHPPLIAPFGIVQQKVEQSDMFHQSSVRNQRPKGFKVKQAFQIILLLAVSIWLLYQIKHSHDKPKEYGHVHKKLRSELGSMVLGRKGYAGSSDGVDTDSDEENLVEKGVRKEDGGGGDDELDRDLEEKAQEESLINGYEDSREKIINHDEKVGAKELETQERESQTSEENNLGTQVREGDEAVNSNNGEEEPLNKRHEDPKDGFTNNVEQEDRKQLETQNEEPENSEKGNPDTEVIDRDAGVGSDKGEEEPLNSGHEDSKEGFTNNVEQEDREKLITQNEEPEKSEEGNLDTEAIDREGAVSSHKQEEEPLNKGQEDSKESFTENAEHEDRKKPDAENEESEKSEKGNPDAEAVGSDKDNDEGKDSKGNAEDIVMKHNETESITSLGQSKMGDGIHRFDDENGVPQDGHDLLITHRKGTKSDEHAKATNLDHGTISSFDNQNQLTEFRTNTAGESSNLSQADEQTDRGMSTDSLIIKQDVVRTQESGNFAEFETVSTNKLEGSETESKDSVENISQSGDKSDVSSIEGSSDQRSSSGSSQQENEEATSVNMVSQAENAL